MESLKIAVFHNLPSGGAKRALYGYVKYLSLSGHEVDVFIPSTAEEEFLPLKNVANSVNEFPVENKMLKSIFPKLDYIPPLFQIYLKKIENAEKEIAETINSKNYDVVFSEQDQYTLSPYFLKYNKKPLAYYCPQPLRNDAISKVIFQNKDTSISALAIRMGRNYFMNKGLKLDKNNASYAKYILTNSYFTHESILRAYGLNSFVSYLGIDTELFKPIDVPEEDFVLSVGTCTPEKGYEFIVRSLAKIDAKTRPKFIIVSNSSFEPFRIYLEKLAKELEVKLEILRSINDEELTLLYNKAALVLYAPYLEPFGLVPIESMGCGTPIVGVKEGGVRESVVDGKTGLLLDRDEEIFASAILKLLNDESKRIRMGKESEKIIKKSWALEKAEKRLVWHLKRAMDLY
ncbi:glycosyltransferase family 4 protein [Methanobacterium sp. ACI-7]|uniref:glycosyltransferase family 4 protein n=1 Tax=unclassified Methanobacterium TaxID=2627676 RepID=UPI0039C4BBF3